MKHLKFTIILLLLLAQSDLSQPVYNSFIDSLSARVSLDSLTKTILELSGELETVIGGQNYRLISRRWSDPGNQKAAEYLRQRFERFGLQTRMQVYDSGGVNVIAKKIGVKYPNQYYLIGAHYDDILLPTIVSDTVPGADDNASGIAAILEAARILALLNLDYTVIFVTFDEEEYGGYNNYNGSMAFADTAFFSGDSLVGAIILDVIGWDGNNDNKVSIISDPNSVVYEKFMIKIMNIYQPLLVPGPIGPLSGDTAPFRNRGFAVIGPTEFISDLNPFFHTTNDRFNKFNQTYYFRIVKSCIAALASLSMEYYINFLHEPVVSSADTSARTAEVIIRSHFPVSKGINRPRLYFKERFESSFSYVNAFYSSNDTFRFEIPGKPSGSAVSYYFAAQDSMGIVYGTLPWGGEGINPPGTIQPDTLFTYYVYNKLAACSNNLPLNISPSQLLTDSILVNQAGTLSDVNVNLTLYHSNDGDLLISLVNPEGTTRALSIRRGGSGDNYINTTFDDEAADSIKNGTPPFTGYFVPDSPIKYFYYKPVSGVWKIKIFNFSTNITGQLVSWCLNFEYFNPIGIANNEVPVKYFLSQNYPNPFNSSTSIKFSVPKQTHVKIAVYDVLGREVKVLVNSQLNYGDHNLSFDANNLSSGLYFYSMYLDGNLFESRKMVLVK